MALWLNHPRYVPARERLIEYLQSRNYRFRKLESVVFLCGGAASARRETLRGYLRKHHPELRLFYAEEVWQYIAASTAGSALKMEAELAQLADLLVIIVESPGTFAELGAFSLSDDLRTKLLPLVDEQFQHSESFLSTGPLRWIETDSLFRPPISVDFDRVLEAATELAERISRLPAPAFTAIDDLAGSRKLLLFFLCDLVALIQPATAEMVELYLGRITPSLRTSGISIPTLLGLGVVMGLLRVSTTSIGGSPETFYSPVLRDALRNPYHQRRLLDLPSQRADHVSVLLAIPEARDIIDSLSSS